MPRAPNGDGPAGWISYSVDFEAPGLPCALDLGCGGALGQSPTDELECMLQDTDAQCALRVWLHGALQRNVEEEGPLSRYATAGDWARVREAAARTVVLMGVGRVVGGGNGGGARSRPAAALLRS